MPTVNDRVAALEQHIKSMQEDLTEYRLEQKANNVILLSVQAQVSSLVSIGKWLVGLLSTFGIGVAIGIIVALVTHFL